MRFAEARTEIAAAGVRLERDGLLSGTAGNLSSRVDPELIAITPSGIPYHEIASEDVVIADLDGKVVDGARRPSSELPFHTAVYRARGDAGAVVHTHSPYATVLAIMRRPIPAVHYAIAAFGVSEVPVVPYATFGSHELADGLAAAVAGGAGGALLANHGAVTLAPSLPEACELASVLEFLACAYYRVLVAGEVTVLRDEEIDRVTERNRSYGQP